MLNGFLLTFAPRNITYEFVAHRYFGRHFATVLSGMHSLSCPASIPVETSSKSELNGKFVLKPGFFAQPLETVH